MVFETGKILKLYVWLKITAGIQKEWLFIFVQLVDLKSTLYLIEMPKKIFKCRSRKSNDVKLALDRAAVEPSKYNHIHGVTICLNT